MNEITGVIATSIVNDADAVTQSDARATDLFRLRDGYYVGLNADGTTSLYFA